MNGAESLVRTMTAAGVDVCFANPGTTEMHLVQALDSVGGVRAVLGLFEGVCSGAADGYARMAGRPAMTLLHLGPGLANGLANLHNAHRARTPVFSVVGDHATWHRGRDAPLETDIESFARPVSKWVHTSTSAQDVAGDTAKAIGAALSAPGGVATLIVPADCAWGDAEGPARPIPGAPPAAVLDDAVEAAARALAGERPAALLLGATALTEVGLRAAGRIAAATGCLLYAETFPARVERGGGLPTPQRLPYFPEEATAALAQASRLVLAGAVEPVAFFGYPGLPSELAPPGMPVETLADPAHDAADALERLADRLGAGADPAPGPPAPSLPPDGPITPTTLSQVIAAGQPEDAIVVDEGLTVSAFYVAASGGAARHTYMALTGGAIGQGPPSATGAAIACPDRPVINLQADGSGMYTAQALWTQARERLDVTTLVCSNRVYGILLEELARAGVQRPGPQSTGTTSLGDPALDWVALATGMGVPASRATTTQELARELDRALAEPGPHVVEMML
ncbi:MAG: acetolactate synthase large subunit [Solirubrobacteraceae bacterium]|jgi:acetolactate synthase-1/2/3 large subunit|nr:acetolactate synthase large subunit [Solirubrobacteraceae bacterium]